MSKMGERKFGQRSLGDLVVDISSPQADRDAVNVCQSGTRALSGRGGGRLDGSGGLVRETGGEGEGIAYVFHL